VELVREPALAVALEPILAAEALADLADREPQLLLLG
jgi:hypothetical protein